MHRYDDALRDLISGQVQSTVDAVSVLLPHINKGALRALCLSDDPWATRPAIELLCAGFTSIKPEILDVAPDDAGVSRIGHLGFFRPEHRDTLWRGAAEWLQA